MNSRIALAAAGVVLAVTVGCSDEDGTGPGGQAAFEPVQSLIAAGGCRSCHNAVNSGYHGAFELAGDRAADSAMVQNFLNFEYPARSPLAVRPTINGGLTHPARLWDAIGAEPLAIAAYAGTLASAGANRTLTAVRAATVPVVDGVADPAWTAVPGIRVTVHGGFAGHINVTLKAMYTPGDRVYFLLQWSDPTESVERGPWLRTVTGWLHQSVTPPMYQSDQLANWRREPAGYLYEDKLAIIWNTGGASSVAGFDDNGCSVLCHVNRPGDPRPLKYSNADGETADMWHWKLVRTNVVHRLDDQYVYWNRSVSVNANGGRAGDPGGGEYTGNGTTVPLFTSGNQPAGRYYLVDSATAVQWAAAGLQVPPEDIALPMGSTAFNVGDQVAYAITTLKPNVDRSHVESYGVWSAGTWTLEIARNLTTNSTGAIPAGGTATVPVDVQFDVSRSHSFGLAVFNNAQIEHSWSPAVYRLLFQP